MPGGIVAYLLKACVVEDSYVSRLDLIETHFAAVSGGRRMVVSGDLCLRHEVVLIHGLSGYLKVHHKQLLD
jgi:hypothetical protein